MAELECPDTCKIVKEINALFFDGQTREEKNRALTRQSEIIMKKCRNCRRSGFIDNRMFKYDER